jgi:hypothetical protein
MKGTDRPALECVRGRKGRYDVFYESQSGKTHDTCLPKVEIYPLLLEPCDVVTSQSELRPVPCDVSQVLNQCWGIINSREMPTKIVIYNND